MLRLLPVLVVLAVTLRAGEPAPTYPRPLRELYSSYFPFNAEPPVTPENWPQRKEAVRERILLACGLLPLPTKAPLNPVIHGRIERDDYTIDRVFFESFPGHYVCGNLYMPKAAPKDGKMPGILCPHGHWPNGRFMDLGAGSAAMKAELAFGAERFENGARSPLQARCVQLARMGCAVFFYDMLGYCDSIQIAEHRSGRREGLCGTEPGTFGLFSPMADLRLESSFGLQTWNSIRALDFILSLPNIDTTRISCTGASGGGTQTMMLAAIDDRLTTAFPCVMVSTAMQGGCSCENANYLRINQGNIDIAANFAPKPMGMTAANDWTKELQTKGFPDLKSVWTKLGKPNNVMATYNIHFQHNYNHVMRTTMYGFMNRNFKLGFSEPVLERDFVFSSPGDLTVWTAEHSKPSGEKVGGEHEKVLLKYWSEDSDKQVKGNRELLAKGWSIIVGRKVPVEGELDFEKGEREDAGAFNVRHPVVKYTKENETLNITVFTPKADWNGTVVIWLQSHDVKEPDAAMKKLIESGAAVAVPELYLPGAKLNPWNPVGTKDQTKHDNFAWSACFTYGYNPPLLVRRVHDVMSAVAATRIQKVENLKRVVLVATDGMGAVGALAAATLKDALDGAVIDTEGFRFASLTDPMHVQFVPGAVKYGDLSGLLSLIDPGKLTVLGEKDVKGGGDAAAAAVLKGK